MTPKTPAWALVGALLMIAAGASQPSAAVDAEPMADGSSSLPAETYEFVATGRLAHGRIWHSATLLPDGRVLVIGGYDESTAET